MGASLFSHRLCFFRGGSNTPLLPAASVESRRYSNACGGVVYYYAGGFCGLWLRGYFPGSK